MRDPLDQPPQRGLGFHTAGWALLALAGLSACTTVSLDEPPRVVTVQPAPVPRPVPPGAAPVPGVPATPVPPAPPVAVASPITSAGPPPLGTLPPTLTGGDDGARYVESPAVAARFPEPPVTYRTPGFDPGRTTWTSNAEIQSWLRRFVREDNTGAAGGTSVRLIAAGNTTTGTPLEALLFTRDAGVPGRPAKPTILLVGQQHGDEPAGSEALLVVAQELAQGRLAPLLDRINVLILARANPDGAQSNRRITASGIDANRDHLLLRTPEAQAQAQLAREYDPAVIVDLHEYSVLGRFVDKFGAVQRYDLLFQYATTANLPEFIGKASEEWFRRPLMQALRAQNISTEWYYTTSTDPADRKISMGGVQPDVGRNVGGLRNAISILIETRGIGLDRAHFARRVWTQVTAVESILTNAANRAPDLLKVRQFVGQELAAKACTGQMVVEAAATPSEYTLTMLDPVTGTDRKVSVAWDSALELAVQKTRARPCGYLLRADQTDAVLRLRGLGLNVQRIDDQAALRGESYRELSRDSGAARSDVRGSIADAGSGVVKVKVELVPALIDVAPGSYYVGLDQPLANLAIAALEPDTQNSFFANRVVTALDAQARVIQRPVARMSAMP